ncbi:Tyramine/octopamine receptor [Fasciola hepatica]|uniref:Tyramine/octopamine receptor n=1 Tax=Fasciola hepatica TaxID=6192 RepID=A0A2H1CI46_FASHE|nr:Tyramine/octopamine receptor [Fasciola hepatica]
MYFHKVGLFACAVLTIAITVLIIVGNVIVIISVLVHPPLRQAHNSLLVSLAVADLAVGLLVVPLNIVTIIFNGQWIFGPIWCTVHMAADIFFCTASILNLCTVAVDRYLVIRYPAYYLNHRTLTTFFSFIILVYLLSALIVIPPLFGWAAPDYATFQMANHTRFQCSFNNEIGYVIYSSLGSFYLPASLLVIIYVKLFHLIRSRLKVSRTSALYCATRSHLVPGVASYSSVPSCSVSRAEVICTGSITPLPHGTHNPEKAQNDIYEIDHLSYANYLQGKSERVGYFGNNPFLTRPSTSSTSGPCVGNQSMTLKCQNSVRRDHQIYRSLKDYQNLASPVNLRVSLYRKGIVSYSTRSFVPESREFDLHDKVLTHCSLTQRSQENVSLHTVGCSATSNLTQERLTPKLTNRIANILSKRELKLAVVNVIRHNSSVKIEEKADHQRTTPTGLRSIEITAQIRQQVSMNHERRAVRTLLIIVGTFVLCWLPFFIMYLLTALCHEYCPLDWTIQQGITWLGYANSAMNPIIYTVFNMDFQTALRHLFHCNS